MSETKAESKIRDALKVYQWVEVYRAVADGEIKAAIKTLYKMKCWHDLHVALWTNKKQFAELNVYAGFTMSEFKELNGWRETVPEYVKDYVPVNVYMR